MRIVAVVLAVLGIFGLVLAQFVDVSVRRSATLVQLIDPQKKLVGTPIFIYTPDNAPFVKGTGPGGSKFLPAQVVKSSPTYVVVDPFLGIIYAAKIGSALVCLLGGLGWWFETRLQRNLRLAMIPYEEQ